MYAILDIETTGGKYNKEGITEIAIYQHNGQMVTDKFISLINPERPIQPFVENAINHGLNFKEERGLLEIIVIQIDEDAILCTIKDNGIGRLASKKIQERTEKYHKSRGMQIIEERLSTLELMQEMNIDIQVKDLYDSNQSKGTQVEILIRLAVD